MNNYQGNRQNSSGKNNKQEEKNMTGILYTMDFVMKKEF